MLLALHQQGHQIIVNARNSQVLLAQFPDIETLQLDFSTAVKQSDWLPHLNSVDVVINTVGIIQETATNTFANIHTNAPVALFKACKQAGINRVIQISALGAAVDQPVRYHASKGAADEQLKLSGLNWIIFKPSLVYGAGAKSTGLFRALAALPVVPLIGDGQQLIQPVHVDDLVEAIMIAIHPDTLAKQTLLVVGPTAFSFASLLAKLRHWLGKPEARYIAIPIQWIQVCAPLGRWLNEPALNKAAISMLEQGNTADVQPFAKYLGYTPKSMDQSLQEATATQADRWHARLYLIRPFLRVAIALVWLWAGWVSVFLYPLSSSYQMLDQLGMPQVLMPVFLYGTSAIDVLLGLALFMGWHLRWVVYAQLIIILLYTAVISVALPEYWLHPFGPIIKNIPLIVTTLILLTLEEEKP